MTDNPEEQALRREIAQLEAKVNEARDELYGLSASYAASHFRLQSDARSLAVERLRRAGTESEAGLLRRKCEQLEHSIRELREVLTDLGIDPEK